jgi:hypothetical protein
LWTFLSFQLFKREGSLSKGSLFRLGWKFEGFVQAFEWGGHTKEVDRAGTIFFLSSVLL